MEFTRYQVPCVAVLLNLLLFINPEQIKAQGLVGKRDFADVHFDVLHGVV